MADYSAYQAGGGPTDAVGDNSAYSMGIEFYVTSQAWVTHLHFWQPTGNDPSPVTRSGALWSVTNAAAGTNVSGTQTYPATVPGWNSLELSTPVELVPNQRYRAVVLQPAGRYSAVANFYSSGAGATDLVVGPLVIPSAANTTGGHQNSFAGGGAMAFPDSAFNSASYGLDVTVTDVDPGGALSPTITAGRDRPVELGSTVQLDVAAAPPDGETITSYAWSITSGAGSLTGDTTSTPTYTPPGSGVGVATIECTVTASGGGLASDTMQVGYGSTIVAAENQLSGTARASWDLSNPNYAGHAALQGFCDGFSADRSGTVDFKIAQSDAAGWSAQVYRLGWYDGDGARLVDELTPDAGQLTASQAQPAPTNADPDRTRVSADCSAWDVTLTWDPPAWAPSGMYVLRLARTGGGVSHVLFILRDDARTADLMVMPADSTWQAYNAFGGMDGNLLAGNSLYYGTDVDQYDADCARFVSHDRPLVNRASANTGQDYGAVRWSNFFTGEYPMVRWLERNGYDVKYYSCADAAGDPDGELLDTVSAAMAIGHNEYWSNAMRAGWETAKADGRHLFFCASNEVFWRTVGTDPDGEGRPRTFECQKSTIGGRGNTRPEWTGTWRDPDGAGKGGDSPENTLTGTIFVVNGPDLRALRVPFAGGYSAQPIWRDTEVADLTTGEWVSPAQILGFEWDTYGPTGVDGAGAAFLAAPHPQVRYASSATYTISAGLLLNDAGDVYASGGDAEHRLVIHPSSPAGGITFGTGSVNWALGLDDAHTYQGVGDSNTSDVIRQATVNMLADMGVVPATLMAGMVEPEPVVWFDNIGSLSGALPVPTGAAAGDVATSGALAAVLPVPEATLAGVPGVTGTVDAALPTPTAAVSGVSGTGGGLAANLPTPTAGLVGEVVDGVVGGTVAATLPAPTGVFAAQSGAFGALTGVLPVPTAAFVEAVDLSAWPPVVTGPFSDPLVLAQPS